MSGHGTVDDCGGYGALLDGGASWPVCSLEPLSSSCRTPDSV
jgi:hypothetical protein